ncbi:hypothetical protein DFP72DRAFT_610640 [Ephemerocybe angulata]|uniref:phytol kinase n=1 Tax=Ephemerocybe angulata TaxID=980116 RepID=A0A8H6HI83_9AGAR|nr:hypothetical protein DFP72DRAFT_610640 [Tulosesus angulatus]
MLVLQALFDGYNIPMVRSFTDDCLRVLIDFWPAIIGWMKGVLFLSARLLADGRSWVTTAEGAGLCAVTLMIILLGAEIYPLKLELMAMPCTADFVILLLCQVHPQTKRHFYLPISESGNEACLIIQVLRLYMESPVSWHVMHTRLRTAKLLTRRTVVRFITVRIEEIVSDSDQTNILSAAKTYMSLAEASSTFLMDRTLWDAFQKEDFILRYTSALYDLTEKAQHLGVTDKFLWAHISRSIATLVRVILQALSPNPSADLPKMIEGGILECSYICLSHTTLALFGFKESTAYQALESLQPYLYLSQVFVSAVARGQRSLWVDRLECGDECGQEIRRSCQEALSRGRSVYVDRQKCKINMCNNMKHPKEDEGHDLEGYFSSLKTCQRCHSVTYCSKECQREDWLAFHSKECPALSLEYSAQKHDKSWPSVRIRRDQLRSLEAGVNLELPILPDLTHQASETVHHQVPEEPLSAIQSTEVYEAGLFLSQFDYGVTRAIYEVNETYPLNSYYTTTWGPSQGKSPWIPRIQQYIRDMEADRDNILLVEGIFRLDERKDMATFIKFRYDHRGPEGGRYTVVSSFAHTTKPKPGLLWPDPVQKS